MWDPFISGYSKIIHGISQNAKKRQIFDIIKNVTILSERSSYRIPLNLAFDFLFSSFATPPSRISNIILINKNAAYKKLLLSRKMKASIPNRKLNTVKVLLLIPKFNILFMNLLKEILSLILLKRTIKNV